MWRSRCEILTNITNILIGKADDDLCYEETTRHEDDKFETWTTSGQSKLWDVCSARMMNWDDVFDIDMEGTIVFSIATPYASPGLVPDVSMDTSMAPPFVLDFPNADDAVPIICSAVPLCDKLADNMIDGPSSEVPCLAFVLPPPKLNFPDFDEWSAKFDAKLFLSPVDPMHQKMKSKWSRSSQNPIAILVCC